MPRRSRSLSLNPRGLLISTYEAPAALTSLDHDLETGIDAMCMVVTIVRVQLLYTVIMAWPAMIEVLGSQRHHTYVQFSYGSCMHGRFMHAWWRAYGRYNM